MTRVVALTAFVTLACAIVGGLHYYFWLRLVRDTQLQGVTRQIATWAIVLLAALIVATFAGRLVPRVGRAIAWPGFIWMGAMFLLLVSLLGGDLARLAAGVVARLGHATNAVDPSRRLFTARLLAGGALTAMAGLTAAAIRATQSEIAVKRVEITLDRLPRALDGTTIVQLCDMHIGGLLGRPFVERVVATVNRLRADVVAVVGDLVDGNIDELRPALAPMRELQARHGTFFVTGNHEYYNTSGARAWMRELARMGMHVLDNQHVTLGSGTDAFDLAGVPDHGASRFPEEGDGENVARALAGRDPSRAVVLLAHQPKAIETAAPLDVDLQLSGHTHGGQIWPWGALVRLQQPFIRGLHRIGRSQLYVSCGTGFWGPPMRLGAPAEITQIVLRSGAA